LPIADTGPRLTAALANTGLNSKPDQVQHALAVIGAGSHCRAIRSGAAWNGRHRGFIVDQQRRPHQGMKQPLR
jgi:hypothetical protein